MRWETNKQVKTHPPTSNLIFIHFQDLRDRAIIMIFSYKLFCFLYFLFPTRLSILILTKHHRKKIVKTKISKLKSERNETNNFFFLIQTRMKNVLLSNCKFLIKDKNERCNIYLNFPSSLSDERMKTSWKTNCSCSPAF